MKGLLIAAAFAASTTTAFAGGDNFDKAPPGAKPPGWICGVTGGGSPVWTIKADPSALSQPNVLEQSGAGNFPWCAVDSASIGDGYVEVAFKVLAGHEDQAGGVVWRFKDGDNYYVARANALEDNVSLYYTERGRRITIKYVDAPVAKKQWHKLRVDFAGQNIKVSLDGKTYIDTDDAHISGGGSVGVWTKADSITAFDDFAFDGR
jgi:hypothetical protein